MAKAWIWLLFLKGKRQWGKEQMIMLATAKVLVLSFSMSILSFSLSSSSLLYSSLSLARRWWTADQVWQLLMGRWWWIMPADNGSAQCGVQLIMRLIIQCTVQLIMLMPRVRREDRPPTSTQHPLQHLAFSTRHIAPKNSTHIAHRTIYFALGEKRARIILPAHSI